MRRLAVLQGCLALLFALFMAPYQHVHVARNQPGQPEHHHDSDSEVVHAHFYAVSIPAVPKGAPELDDLPGGHVSRPLDTFKTVPAAALFVFVVPTARSFLFAPEKSSEGLVEFVEARGHDPPWRASTAPRPPPA